MVWVWGDNKQAQLGLSDYTPRQTPYPLLSLNDKQIDQIAIGQNFCIAISRKPKLTFAESLNLVTLNGNSDRLNVVNSDGSLLNHMQGKPSVTNLQ
jgi:alpha-tubulin suppressor-like RCC1 family protein